MRRSSPPATGSGSIAVPNRCVADAVTPPYTRSLRDCRIQASAKARLHCLWLVVRNVAFASAWRASDKPCVCFRTWAARGAATCLRPHPCPLHSDHDSLEGSGSLRPILARALSAANAHLMRQLPASLCRSQAVISRRDGLDHRSSDRGVFPAIRSLSISIMLSQLAWLEVSWKSEPPQDPPGFGGRECLIGVPARWVDHYPARCR